MQRKYYDWSPLLVREVIRQKNNSAPKDTKSFEFTQRRHYALSIMSWCEFSDRTSTRKLDKFFAWKKITNISFKALEC